MTKSRILIASLILSISFTSRVAPAASARAYEELIPAAIIVSDHDLATFMKARDIASENGARGLQMYPPDVVFGRFEKAPDPSLFSGLHVKLAFSSDKLATAGLDATLRGAIGSLFDYREALMRAMVAEGTPPADAGPPVDDVVLRVPPDLVRMTTPRGPRCGSPMDLLDRGISQNSEFMIGSVLLNVIFPESMGNGENWTDDEISSALVAMTLGIAQYQARATWTDLSFTINRYIRVPVSMEPIRSDMSTDGIWIGEVIANIGYNQGALYGTHLLNNATRARFGTEWAYTAYIVDMSNHYENYTADSCWGGAGYVAYSYLGGPYMLIPYPACRYGPGLGFGRVFIHEMSHGFWALDEYASAQVLCKDASGYLGVPTRNTLYFPCQETVPCIMQTASPPFTEPLPICEYTLGQVGLADDGNSVPLIYNVAPTIEFLNVLPDQIDYLLPTETDYEIEALAKNAAVPNVNPQQNSEERMDVAPTIVGCSLSIQGAPEIDLSPTDGKWNSASEYIIYKPQLDPGLNKLVFTVRNRVDLKARIEKKIYQYGIRYYYVSTEASPDAIQVNWVTSGEVFGAVFDVVRTDLSLGGGEELLATLAHPEDSSETRRSYGYRDTMIVTGHRYLYKITGRFSIVYPIDHKTYSFAISSGDIEETAIVPVAPTALVSPLVPNPVVGGERTMFTIDVPVSYRTSGDTPYPSSRSGARPSALATQVKTRVEVIVYNVLGQRMRTIYSNATFKRYLPVEWDGTDSNGRRVTPGVYFISVQAGDRNETKKLVILR
jgi:hypothetical protein